MSKKRIVNKEEQKFLYSSLPEVFGDLDPSEIADIISKLGITDSNLFTWIKYSNYSNGKNESGIPDLHDESYILDPNHNKVFYTYMGIAYNKETPTASNIPEDYKWSKVGGTDGSSSYTVELSNDNTSVPALADGSIPNPEIAFSTANTEVSVYQGSLIVDRSKYDIVITSSSGIEYTTTDTNHKIQVTALTGETEYIRVTVVSKASGGNLPFVMGTSTFNVSKLRGTSVYEIFPTTTVIKVQQASSTSPVILIPSDIGAKIKLNSGQYVIDTFRGKLTYRYVYPEDVGQDLPGIEIPIGQTFLLNYNTEPIFVEFKYYNEDNILCDVERIPFIKDGDKGETGENGTFVEFIWAKNGSFTEPPILERDQANPVGWSKTPITIGELEYSWKAAATKKDENTLVGIWSLPVRDSGPSGPKGDIGPAGEDGPWISAQGQWVSTVQYKSDPVGNVVQAVWYVDSWYVTRIDVTDIPIGTPPTNTTYWNKSQANYDFQATGLFLAQAAWIDNLGVNNLKTSLPDSTEPNPKRVEIISQDNAMKFFVEGSTTPNIQIDAIPGMNTVGNPQVVATMYMKGIAQDGDITTTSVSTEGILANGGNTSFIASSTGIDTSTSIAGLHEGTPGTSGQLNNESAHTGIAGINNLDDMYGSNYGGYLNTGYIGSLYQRVVSVSGSGGNTQIDRFTGLVINYSNGNNAITLPRMATITEGYKSNTAYTVSVLNVNANVLTVNASSGNTIFVSSGSGSTEVSSAQLTNRSRANFIWDGTAWHSM